MAALQWGRPTVVVARAVPAFCDSEYAQYHRQNTSASTARAAIAGPGRPFRDLGQMHGLSARSPCCGAKDLSYARLSKRPRHGHASERSGSWNGAANFLPARCSRWPRRPLSLALSPDSSRLVKCKPLQCLGAQPLEERSHLRRLRPPDWRPLC